MWHDTGSRSPRAQANGHLTRVAALAVAALAGPSSSPRATRTH